MVLLYLPKAFFPGTEALPVIQYLQSLCRLSFELLQGTEALGENQDRGEALTSLGVLC